MGTYVENLLFFFLFGNILLFNAAHGSIINRSNNDGDSKSPTNASPVPEIQIQLIPANDSESNDLNGSSAAQGAPADMKNLNNDVNDSHVAQNTAGDTLPNSANILDNLLGSNQTTQDAPQNQNNDVLMNILRQLLAGTATPNANSQIESKDNPDDSIGITVLPVAQNDSLQNNTAPAPQGIVPAASTVAQETGSTQNTPDSIGITIEPATQNDSSQCISPAESTSTALVPEQQTDSAQNAPDSIGITIEPATQNESSQYSTPAESTSTALVPYQQGTASGTGTTATPLMQDNDTTPILSLSISPYENGTTPDQSQQQNVDNNSAIENSTPDQGCGMQISVSPQPTLQLNQVTVSQILYHLKMQYEHLYSKQGNSSETYEVIQTQQTFLREMLQASKEVTSENNKNIVSTTYAAYYSTEYAYTFLLCKLHHTAAGATDKNNPTHANTSSKCSQIMKTFSSFSMSYKEIISQVIENNGSDVLKYDNKNDDGQTNTDNGTPNDSNTNTPSKKVSTSNDETIERQNLEKDLHGYDPDKFYNRVRSEGTDLDQFDTKQSQQIGDSVYSNETKGKKSDSTAYLLSEVRGIPKNASLDDPSNGAQRLRKMSNTLRINSDADTRGHVENGEIEINSDHLQHFDETQRQLDQLERNYFDDDNKNIGGNIKNAKLQDVEKHYSSTVQHIRDVNGQHIESTFSFVLFSEQVTIPKPQQTNAKKYTFKQAVEKLTTYIEILHVFTANLEKHVQDKKATDGKQVADTLHEDIYQKTLSYRQYLKEYFASTNVESGTFSGKTEVDTIEQETESWETTVEKRFSLLESADPQGQTNSPQSPTDTKDADKMKADPIQLLWYFEEASYYMEHLQQSQIEFMSYLPYPDYNVKAVPDNQNGADVQFFLN
ncbi:uncharacterized protein LOC135839753 isoform X3 [Planococcus citri]|uniref:uncharacterized protein LOC135839753 isoform X3 n=1 Tax=Planococcus citri TaxID=170843 RepID=UPI0031F9BAAE